MAQLHTHVCPSCGAPLAEGDQPQARCSYCGSSVTVDGQPGVPRVTPPIAIPFTTARAANVAARTALGGIGLSVFSIIFVIFTCLVLCVCFSLFIASLPPGDRSRPIATFGGEGTGPGQFDDANHVAIDGNGNVYVADGISRRVQRFDENGKYLGEWSIDAKGKQGKRGGPQGLAADRAGNIYVLWTGMILKYEGVTGKLLDTIAGDPFDAVTRKGDDFKCIAIRPDGELWALSNVWSDDLVHLDADGNTVARIKRAVSTATDDSVLLSYQLGMTVDGQGNIYLLNYDYWHPTIFKFTPEGKFVKGFDARAGQEILLHILNPEPFIAVDKQDRVYFADTDGIRVFDGEGQYLKMISNSMYNNKPFGMAINSKNEIYVIGDDDLIFKLAPLK